MDRNIKQVGGWAWQEKETLRLLASHYSGEKLRAARSVYLALTEIASDSHTPGRCKAACSYIGKRAGDLSEGSTRRYLHEFATLGLVAIDTARAGYNVYHLLAIGAVVSEQPPTMPLADGRGISHAPLTADRGFTSEPQENNEILINNNYKQTVGDAAIPAMDTETVKQLTGLGVRRDVATEITALYPAAVITAWVAYALKADGLKSRAGFVLAMLRSGATPSVTVARSGCERRFDGWQAVAKPTDEQRARWEMRELASSYPQNISD